ncbi:myristoylated alanine-rich C-kinase substrate-like [Rhipicephalus sanguineus]|uniref:myristoylated alanine-rich C-kinase substrate-like n=1 Tax=Rhipicephalus sanguineus TaxID=34632 RepID=UPI0020C2650F|nr:myristoylated alanine-rich C-kinase substrate-like [Rhipicephalus sanguineus]
MSTTKGNAASPTTASPTAGSPSSTGSPNVVPDEKKHKKHNQSSKGSSANEGNEKSPGAGAESPSSASSKAPGEVHGHDSRASATTPGEKAGGSGASLKKASQSTKGSDRNAADSKPTDEEPFSYRSSEFPKAPGEVHGHDSSDKVTTPGEKAGGSRRLLTKASPSTKGPHPNAAESKPTGKEPGNLKPAPLKEEPATAENKQKKPNSEPGSEAQSYHSMPQKSAREVSGHGSSTRATLSDDKAGGIQASVGKDSPPNEGSDPNAAASKSTGSEKGNLKPAPLNEEPATADNKQKKLNR